MSSSCLHIKIKTPLINSVLVGFCLVFHFSVIAHIFKVLDNSFHHPASNFSIFPSRWISCNVNVLFHFFLFPLQQSNSSPLKSLGRETKYVSNRRLVWEKQHLTDSLDLCSDFKLKTKNFKQRVNVWAKKVKLRRSIRFFFLRVDASETGPAE